MANLRPQLPETAGLDAADHLEAVLAHGARVDRFLYDDGGGLAVDAARIRAFGVEPVSAPRGAPRRPRPRSGTVGDRPPCSAVVQVSNPCVSEGTNGGSCRDQRIRAHRPLVHAGAAQPRRRRRRRAGGGQRPDGRQPHRRVPAQARLRRRHAGQRHPRHRQRHLDRRPRGPQARGHGPGRDPVERPRRRRRDRVHRPLHRTREGGRPPRRQRRSGDHLRPERRRRRHHLHGRQRRGLRRRRHRP